jgi:hypothetical protein
VVRPLQAPRPRGTTSCRPTTQNLLFPRDVMRIELLGLPIMRIEMPRMSLF